MTWMEELDDGEVPELEYETDGEEDDSTEGALTCLGGQCRHDTHTRERRQMLDLFLGTMSVGKLFAEMGFEGTSVDSRRYFKPTIVADVLKWYYKSLYQPGYFEVIF